MHIIYETNNTCWLRMKPRLWNLKKYSADAHVSQISSIIRKKNEETGTVIAPSQSATLTVVACS